MIFTSLRPFFSRYVFLIYLKYGAHLRMDFIYGGCPFTTAGL